MCKRIWSEWFPPSEFEAIEGIQFEMYYVLAKHKNGFGGIWLPIKKKIQLELLWKPINAFYLIESEMLF